ncbi:MAG: hypothetical protein QXG71_00295 [Nanopusillaceae archaeon]
MKKSLSFTDIILYLISIFSVVGVAIYLSAFFQVENQVLFDTNSYGYFLNTIYVQRLYYCIYDEIKDPYYLFYFPAEIEKINDYSSLKNCFTIISNEYKELLENKTEIDSIIIKYNIRNVSEVPIFLFYDLKNKRKIWIKEHGKDLFYDEQKNIWNSFLDYINPINWFMKNIELMDKAISMLEYESNIENLLSCDTDRTYYISTIMSLPILAINTKRELYAINTYKFIRIRGKECKKVIYTFIKNPETGKRTIEVKEEKC